MNIKTWQILASAVAATLAVLALLGFNSPANAGAELRLSLHTLEKRVDGHDVMLAEQRTDLKYIKEGIDELRHKNRR